jgi:hypothetical protein
MSNLQQGGFQQGGFQRNTGGFQSERPKTNFRIDNIWGADARMNLTIWKADTGARLVISIAQFVGKDPEKGTNIVEQKMPNELPSVYLNSTVLRAMYQFIEKQNPSSMMGKLEMGNRAIEFLSESGKAVIKITAQDKPERKITFDTVTIGNETIHAGWEQFKSTVKVCLDKIATMKIDSFEELAPAGGKQEDSEF